MAAFVAFDSSRTPQDCPCFPGVCPPWDNTARRPPGKAIVFRGSAPDLFGRWVAAKRDSFVPRGDQNPLFINAWNEWAEGNHLEPCLAEGHGWLDALRDNLVTRSGNQDARIAALQAMG